MKKITFRIFVTIFFLLIVAYFLRNPLAKVAGNSLIYEDELESVNAMFILSGAPLERGNEAVKLMQQGYAKKIICVGGNQPVLLKVLDINYLESELTKLNLSKQDIADSIISVIPEGTSTMEESETILKHCLQYNIKKCIVLSSKFHTRRIKKVFKKKFKKNGIHLIIRGAPSTEYDEEKWWQSEQGMIAFNNEYVKLIYYFIKY